MRTVLKFLMWMMFPAASLLLAPGPVAASCTCACVEGQVKSICSNSLEIAVPCPPTVCPLSTPANPVIDPLTQPQTLPPNPADRCTDRQVYNPQTGRNEWRRLCS